MAEAGGQGAARPRVLIDACVLYPGVLREAVTGCAAAGLFVPHWSPRILAEWAHAAGRLGPEGAAQAAGAIAGLRAAFPAAEVLPEAGVEAMLDLPDAADRHVLAAAIAAGADVLLTANLRDFPRRELAPHGIAAESPDDFLMRLWLAAPAPVEAVIAGVQAATERASGRAQPLRPLLKRAGLPRLGRALQPPASPGPP